MIEAVYHPGVTAIHRASAGTKLLALLVVAIVVSSTDSLLVILMSGAFISACWYSADVPLSMVAKSLRPAAWLLGAVFAFQFFIASPVQAISVVLALGILITAAALVSLTTRMDDMLAALQSALNPLTRFGLPVPQIAFALVFIVRLVPFISTICRAAIEARIARGGSANVAPALIPTVIRMMREADALADALVARGFERT